MALNALAFSGLVIMSAICALVRACLTIARIYRIHKRRYIEEGVTLR